ncbi:hypothetical protein [Brevundimonas naejangsanensis]|uniref:hypothetical protein n=1 Tax=Brevundimonas naejangsanensis TaxID=588932 RepID=UPI00046269B3|nr:hypothetical protein [Brevundimonas naejangsanensis]
MTHPLTPREKVIAILDEHTTVGGTSAYRTGSVNSDELSGLILTALASGSGDHSGGVTDMIGSGDHAELARLAETAICCEDANYPAIRGDFGKAANPATVLALLAENVALRAERDALLAVDEAGEPLRQAHRDRATEAERKLAEAVGLLRRIEDMCPATCETSLAHDMAQIASEWLSKEAERG